MIEVLEAGPLATVQDLGRPGYAALGVARSGAFDRAALQLANRLVGNPEAAAGIEMTLGGLRFVAHAPVTVALAGAVCPGAPDWGTAVTLPAGAEVRLGAPRDGLRSYLALRGGLAVPAVLGSRSTDLLSGLGPEPLRAGTRLPVGEPSGEMVAALGSPQRMSGLLRIRFGPRDDWFTAEARRRLVRAEWTVRPDSDRIGVRLSGPSLDRVRTGELPSEPMLPGAVQVPPEGRPIIFGPDGPVTGGYPVIAVVADLGPVAQLRPGDTVRFSRGSDAGSPT
jgi:biotin-dependent carboxylase-like uncharacterized protein